MDALVRDTVPRRQGFYVRRDGPWIQTADIAVRHLAGNRYAVLPEDTAYRAVDGRLILAEPGFIFDGGSKPAVTWIIFGHPWADYLASYVIHDWERAEAAYGFSRGRLTFDEAYRAMAQGDRDFKESQRWILQYALGHGQSRWERLKIRIKFRAVQAHSLYRAVRKAMTRD